MLCRAQYSSARCAFATASLCYRSNACSRVVLRDERGRRASRQHLHQISASDFLHPRSAPLVLQAVKSGFFVMENRRFFEKKPTGKQFGFSSAYLLDKNRGKRSARQRFDCSRGPTPCTAITAAQTAGARDAPELKPAPLPHWRRAPDADAARALKTKKR